MVAHLFGGFLGEFLDVRPGRVRDKPPRPSGFPRCAPEAFPGGSFRAALFGLRFAKDPSVLSNYEYPDRWTRCASMSDTDGAASGARQISATPNGAARRIFIII